MVWWIVVGCVEPVETVQSVALLAEDPVPVVVAAAEDERPAEDRDPGDLHPDVGAEPDCDDANVLTDGLGWETLGEALASTVSGVVTVCAGTYTAPVPIQRPVILSGAGIGLTVIDAGADGPAIEVRAGGVLLLTGVTLTGGRNVEFGGGIAVNAGAVARIEDVEITGNVGASGGGVYVGGAAELVRTTITGNLATGDAAPAAGILVGRTATALLEDVELRNNAGKAGMWVDGGFVEVTGGTFGGDGVGLVMGSGGELIVTGSTFSDSDPYGLEILPDAGLVDLGGAAFGANLHDVLLPDGAVLDGVGTGFDLLCADGVCDQG